MTITKRQSTELKKRINQLVVAERADEFKGAGHPEDVELIEEDLRIARKRIHDYIEMLKLDDFRRK